MKVILTLNDDINALVLKRILQNICTEVSFDGNLEPVATDSGHFNCGFCGCSHKSYFRALECKHGY